MRDFGFGQGREGVPGRMDHARKAIYNMFGGEPLSYTRFSLARQPDGDNSHVEMKLSAEDEEVGENGSVDHLHTQTVRPRNSNRHIWFVLSAVAMLFLIGKAQKWELCKPDTGQLGPSGTPEQCPSVVSLLSESYNPHVRYGAAMALGICCAGTGNKVLQQKNLRLDEGALERPHKKLQYGPEKRYMETTYGPDLLFNEAVETPKAYVAYSENGEVSGKPVYANYGRDEDFRELLTRIPNISGSVVLVRAGEIPFAEKVANGKKWGAAGVLIYPDPADFRNLREDVSLFGHAHLGTGDPYTPGFPSFNHTQFPPVESSGLPRIPVQTISSSAARKLFSVMNGPVCPSPWTGTMGVTYRFGSTGSGRSVKLQVRNELVEKKILNIFGIIKGFVEPDRYVVLGAQRDSWGPGAAKAGVGTALLLELARALSDMVKIDGYKPRRSVVFASWSAGDFGSVGATEWLEGYSSSLHLKAFAYINLDSAVTGSRDFKFSASPMLKRLLEEAVTGFKVSSSNIKDVLASKEKPLRLDDASFPFIAYSGIPAISFSFSNGEKVYPYLGTEDDTITNLLSSFGSSAGQLESTMRMAAEIAGRMALRMTHDHELYLDYTSYNDRLLRLVGKFLMYRKDLQKIGLGVQWLMSARGDFNRATQALIHDIANTDLTNTVACRALNDRIMKVEYHFLSPYVSPKDTPLRHIFFGSGSHTLQSMLDQLSVWKSNQSAFNETLFKNQLALATWTIRAPPMPSLGTSGTLTTNSKSVEHLILRYRKSLTFLFSPQFGSTEVDFPEVT
nr:LOW QUALITY PROTEIN: transferrin receptor protein 1 [Anolis sagrei ordinatus]